MSLSEVCLRERLDRSWGTVQKMSRPPPVSYVVEVFARNRHDELRNDECLWGIFRDKRAKKRFAMHRNFAFVDSLIFQKKDEL